MEEREYTHLNERQCVNVWQEENGNDRFKSGIRQTGCEYGAVAYEAGRWSAIVTVAKLLPRFHSWDS